ncbi:hypothetical protein BP00DRAFT_42883 [Aspergillus indologenus CBS 114.80]|uniref:Uncharacterized protein n=1 Tax=Aspergillus indologenus CBS 114.80 TaxID=1450541 RepID=A0A2V5IDI6_9EURO|nr:hypothetical protein BP00DRAFT_42883 [Aspergillus indologenus CBS 114.80]
MLDVTAFWMILGAPYCVTAIFVGFVRYFRETKDFDLVFFLKMMVVAVVNLIVIDTEKSAVLRQNPESGVKLKSGTISGLGVENRIMSIHCSTRQGSSQAQLLTFKVGFRLFDDRELQISTS